MRWNNNSYFLDYYDIFISIHFYYLFDLKNHQIEKQTHTQVYILYLTIYFYIETC